MSNDQHVYHHNIGKVLVNIKISHTTRGDTWELEVKGCEVDEMNETVSQAKAILENILREGG